MKKLILLLQSLILSTTAFSIFLALSLLNPGFHACAQSVSINNNGALADPSALLDMSSSSQGMLVPRMTSTERNAIVSPAAGLMIFNTTTNCFNFYKNNGWFEWCGTCVPPAAPVAGNNGPLCTGSALNLTASTVPFATYSWTGPNGFTSTAQNPIISNVTAVNSGVYSVVSYVNCNSSVATTNVVVSSPPSSGFTFSPATPTVNQSVSFTPTLSGAVYSWAFQSGTPATSTLESPTAAWSVGGTYNISLTVTSNGCVSSVTTQQISPSCPPGSISFSYTGAVQTWTVPACISSITIDAKGAQGGGSGGGNGGRAIATVPVTPGSTLNIYVGGKPTVAPGATSGGFNGGGKVIGSYCGSSMGGGGASDVRTSTNLSDRLLVAAGGGGMGYSAAIGGTGGGLTGSSGSIWASATAAGGGTQSAGGAGGGYNSVYAGNGSLGIGGDAGPTSVYCVGGGGGGGYYGGGGGFVGSGAGGSSWVAYPGSTNASTTAGFNAGNGSISISW